MGPGTQPLVIAREMRSRGHTVSFATSGGVYTEKVKEADFKVHIVPGLAPDKHRLLSVFDTILKLRRIIRAEKPDVIHGHNATSTILAVLAGYLLGRKISAVTSVRGVEERSTHQWRNKIWIMTPGILLGVCEKTRQRLINFGVSSRKIFVTYNGVDLERFNPDLINRETERRKLGISEKLVVGTVGAITGSEAIGGPGKGQHILVKALHELRDRHPDLVVLLVGDGHGRKMVEALANELKLTERVIFVGRRFDTPELLSAMDIYCLASIYGEFFPNSIVEAMAMGLPWVGSDIAGLSELTANDEAGWVSPINDVKALAANIDKLASNRRLRETRGAMAKSEVVENLSIEKVCDRVFRGYQLAGLRLSDKTIEMQSKA